MAESNTPCCIKTALLELRLQHSFRSKKNFETRKINTNKAKFVLWNSFEKENISIRCYHFISFVRIPENSIISTDCWLLLLLLMLMFLPLFCNDISTCASICVESRTQISFLFFWSWISVSKSGSAN